MHSGPSRCIEIPDATSHGPSLGTSHGTSHGRAIRVWGGGLSRLSVAMKQSPLVASSKSPRFGQMKVPTLRFLSCRSEPAARPCAVTRLAGGHSLGPARSSRTVALCRAPCLLTLHRDRPESEAVVEVGAAREGLRRVEPGDLVAIRPRGHCRTPTVKSTVSWRAAALTGGRQGAGQAPVRPSAGRRRSGPLGGPNQGRGRRSSGAHLTPCVPGQWRRGARGGIGQRRVPTPATAGGVSR